MELVYLRYTKDGRLILLLELGSRNNKICGLLSEKVPDHERAKITKARTLLDALSLPRKLQWLKEHCPVTYKTAYREVSNSNAEILSRHAIKN